MAEIAPERIGAIQEALLKWFSAFGRKFPWRASNEPFDVLIAEKLLQQTSVREETIRIYDDLRSLFPSAKSLSEANIDQIREMILPLGLHYRARELVDLAQEISEKYNGIIPDDLATLLSLKGVGDYTARAILCFAFGKDVAVVDTNVARILYRVFGLPGKMPANPARKRSLIKLAGQLIPEGKSCTFNWAMIDLGALVCKASNPLCEQCPLQTFCAYYQSRKLVHAST